MKSMLGLDLVLRLEIYKKLEKHRGCVNTVSFNADGHVNNVFQAKIMPYSDDRTLVTCGADGQVRQAQILERGVETKLLAKHQGRAHKLAIEPGSPHIFYTCGEDGLVQHIDLRTGASTELFAIDKPTLPINIKQFKPKPSGWLYRLPTPQDLMFQLFSLQRRESSPELNRENSTSAESRELMQLILAFDARGGASLDEGGNGSGPEDLFC
ncbi:hypothetical protein V6N12_036486 [Hibiscus sabdariffa]|uniref:Uncharacterized protein n=1 Tax=Hibiscus sabdariffa TaxID=183260 RepID=A0ABR2EQQ8_9ROSI